ncbi:EAL domain-containing protein [Pleionea sp. CnH1-48]|uniref:EAL domain-containing protein n=1 Tax=Pleionea sp. CnH1-48 TaxID=2954494 RepID=UPI0020979D03|nr:EAL domain-containing protein [Pleionea sp. CnH1-48]MCO7225461.1 EAL domain-containing protein [Pleionea sp. CnH1-48]
MIMINFESLKSYSPLLQWLVPILLSIFLIPIALGSYLFFHTLVELFAVIVAVLCFVVAINTYKFSRSHFLMFLGCGYFWVGIFDLSHALAFESFGLFRVNGDDTAIQYWMSARLFESLILLSTSLFFSKPVKWPFFFGIFGGIFATVCIAIYSGAFPVMFVEGKGLTPIKVWGEYLVIFILLVSALSFYYHRHRLHSGVFKLIILSIGLTILAEVAFTLYTTISASSAIVGHILKLFSFWAIYIALVEFTLNQPFKSLSLSANTYDGIPDAITVLNEVGVIVQVNESAARYAKTRSEQLIGRNSHAIFHADVPITGCVICQAIIQKDYPYYQEIERDGHYYEVTLSELVFNDGRVGIVQMLRNITERRLAQVNFSTVSRLYNILHLANKAILETRDRAHLLEEICQIAVQHGNFKMAWIGLIEDQFVEPVAAAGAHDPYLNNIVVKVDGSELSKGPVGIAATTNQVACVNYTRSDESFRPWRDEALRSGFYSLAAVPILKQDQCLGVFAIYSSEENAFDESTLELLSSLSNDISAAMFYIQLEEERIRSEVQLKQLSQAIEQSGSATIITDTERKIEYTNLYFSELTGIEAHEVLGKDIEELNQIAHTFSTNSKIMKKVMDVGSWETEVECSNRYGKSYWSLQSISAIKDSKGDIRQLLWTSKDNTQLHDAQETIRQLAYFDPLTNLPNRRLYQDRIQQAINVADRHHEKVALLYFDLDNFKNINDLLGHDFGDLFLKHVAESLALSVRNSDTVARLGGDEFTVILGDIESVNDIVHVAENILHRLNTKTVIDGRDVVVNSSIGISLYPDDAEDAAQLMKHADMAMYYAKEQGRNNFQFFEKFLNEKAQKRIQLENRLREAIKNKEFILHYQPQFELKSGDLVGIEALVRWNDPERGMISPAEFIPLAEETSLIVSLGRWVIHYACAEFASMVERGFPKVKLAINISANQFRRKNELYDDILFALEQSKLPAHLLQLELTESILVEDIEETIRLLEDFKQQKITLAIDDFGTGYSSLSYLKKFPVDVIKIDRTFVRDIENDSNDRAIVRAMSAMAHELELKVLAEGVENLNQVEFLLQQQCDYTQGFYYSKPLDAQMLFESYHQASSVEDLSD